MKIAMLAPFEESIPPKKYGGTELVIYNLVSDLRAMGHEVVLLAPGDSEVGGEIKTTIPRCIRGWEKLKDDRERECLRQIGISKILKILSEGNFDIIHNHLGWRILPFIWMIQIPMVTTLHGVLSAPHQKEVFKKFKKLNYVSISYSQRKNLPILNFVSNVYNGIKVEKFNFKEIPKDYLAFLGRIAPNKGPVEAIEVAKKAGMKLIIAAKVDPIDIKFYEEKVLPLIDGKQIKYIGEVDHVGKNRLLRNARAVLCPIQWDEPFGLVFTEAMACGTPVLVMNRGSVHEVILNKKTGFICRDTDEMIRRLSKIETIDRKSCRDHVVKKFTSKMMTERYLKTYEKIIRQAKASN